MSPSNRSAMGVGVLLILLGVALLTAQLVPNFWSWVGPRSWPLIVVGVGVVLLLIGVLTGSPGMAVPACIVGGIGGLLFWQNATDNWESWAYAWTLIPGFVGAGVLLQGLWAGDRKALRDGVGTIVVSLILFAVFGAFFGALPLLGKFWPVLLIVGGLVLLVLALLRPRS